MRQVSRPCTGSRFCTSYTNKIFLERSKIDALEASYRKVECVTVAFKEELKKRRIALEMAQPDLAYAIKVSPTTVPL